MEHIKYKIEKLGMQNEFCQWVEIYKDGIFQRSILVNKNATDAEIINQFIYDRC